MIKIKKIDIKKDNIPTIIHILESFILDMIALGVIINISFSDQGMIGIALIYGMLAPFIIYPQYFTWFFRIKLVIKKNWMIILKIILDAYLWLFSIIPIKTAIEAWLFMGPILSYMIYLMMYVNAIEKKVYNIIPNDRWIGLNSIKVRLGISNNIEEKRLKNILQMLINSKHIVSTEKFGKKFFTHLKTLSLKELQDQDIRFIQLSIDDFILQPSQ